MFCPWCLVLTHRHWSRVDIGRLDPPEKQERHLRWTSTLGVANPEWWSIQAGAISAIIVIASSRLTVLEGQFWLPPLGLLAVAGSWGLVVYAFAEKYLDLHLQKEHVDLPDDVEPQFTDFLTQSVAVSTMTGVTGGSRATRTAVRSHTLVAFAFNTVIVALTVSVLFS